MAAQEGKFVHDNTVFAVDDSHVGIGDGKPAAKTVLSSTAFFTQDFPNYWYFIWTGKGYHIVQYAKGGGFFEAKPEGDNTMEGRFTRSDGNVLTITFDEVGFGAKHHPRTKISNTTFTTTDDRNETWYYIWTGKSYHIFHANSKVEPIEAHAAPKDHVAFPSEHHGHQAAAGRD